MMNEESPVVQQGSMILPYFDAEVPFVALADGTRYIPVVALCRMLGLNPRRHIPRWRRLFLWIHACKLPLRTETRGTRMVWCLHLGALLFWCGCFNWSLVSPERQVQLRQATEAGFTLLDQAHQEMLTHYRQMRNQLFRFLTIYTDAQTQLQQMVARMHGRLDAEKEAAFEQLLARGYTLINESTAHARAMLQDQASSPVMDVVTIDAEGNATEIGTLPLLPVVPEKEEKLFIAQLEQLTHWYREFVFFVVEHGILPQEDQNGGE